MVIDDEVDFFRRMRKVRRLQIDYGNPVELPDAGIRYFLNFDLQQLHHRDILRARDAAKRAERRRLPVAANHLAQSESAGNGVRIRIVLQQDQHRFGGLKMSPHFFDPAHRLGQTDVPAEVRLQQFLDRYAVGK